LLSIHRLNRRTGVRAVSLVGAALLVTAAAVALTGRGAAALPSQRNPGWVATWTASPEAGDTTQFSDQTVRNIIYTSVGGSEVQVRLSNTFGSAPLEVGATNLAVVLNGAELVPGTSHSVTFGGQTSVTIPAGQEVLSDPIHMLVPRLTELAVDLYLPAPTGPATYHQVSEQTTYVAAGDQAGVAASTAYTTTESSWYLVDGLDVLNPATPGTVVAFGDSITDSAHSQVGANGRWPNYLSRRVESVLGNRAPAVVDAGISGNRVLNSSSCYGQSAEVRFQRDALSQPGVKAVILLEGVNDIGFSAEADSGCFAPSDPTITAAQIEGGYLQLIRMAHARGVKIYAGTLTPFLGSTSLYGGNYGTPSGEALRQSVNHWILTSHAFDGVVNFASVTADPYDSGYYNPAYNSGDSLHPNDLGCEVMADAIPLGWLTS
jgi:lysophospholipase L1-like esterase